MSFHSPSAKSLPRRDSHDFSGFETTLVDPEAGSPWDIASEPAGGDATLDEMVHDTLDVTFDMPMMEASLIAPAVTPAGSVATRSSNPGVITSAARPSRASQPSRRAHWAQEAKHARRDLASRRFEREALAKVIALAKPRERVAFDKVGASRTKGRELRR